jgi:hypothetical protein
VPLRSPLAFLVRIIQVFESEVASISKQAQKIPRAFSARDQKDFFDPGVTKGLNGIIHHRFVLDREQVLVGHPGEWIKPASRTTCKHDTFHVWHCLPGLDCSPNQRGRAYGSSTRVRFSL